MSFASRTKKYFSKKFKDFLRMVNYNHRQNIQNQRHRGAVGLRNRAYGVHWVKEIR